MVGYGVPAEDLAKFATRISEESGWFSTERGQALLMLARRLSSKRDEGDHAGATKTGGDLERMAAADTLEKQVSASKLNVDLLDDLSLGEDESETMGGAVQKEIAWAHPVQAGPDSYSTEDGVLQPSGFVGKSAVTSLAHFGANAVSLSLACENFTYIIVFS